MSGQSIAYVQVSMKGDLYNIYTDTEGEQQTSLLGNVQDLRSIKVKEIAGIPIEKLQAHYDIQRNRAGKMDAGMPDRMIGFPDQTAVPLPPGTVNVYKVHMLPNDATCSGSALFLDMAASVHLMGKRDMLVAGSLQCYFLASCVLKVATCTCDASQWLLA